MQTSIYQLNVPSSAGISSPTMPVRQQWQTVQALRGVAALAVVGFHLTQFVAQTYQQTIWSGLFTYGFAGVDLFFVISGFVIVYTSQPYIGQPGYLPTYLTKRFIRVYPVYWLVVFAMLLPMLLGHWLSPSGIGKAAAQHWPGLDTFLLTPRHNCLDLVSWSLSHELFFYLLFACLILSRRLWIVPVFFLAGTGIMALTKHDYVGAESTDWAYFWFNPLNAEFALGALAGYLFTRYEISITLARLAAVGGFVWLFSVGETTNEAFSGRLVHFGVAGFLVLLSLLTYEKRQRLTVPRWLVRVGDASYLLYLLHAPLMIPFIRIVPRVLPGYSSLVEFACLLFISLAAVVSVWAHRYVEKPLCRLISAWLLSSQSLLIHKNQPLP